MEEQPRKRILYFDINYLTVYHKTSGSYYEEIRGADFMGFGDLEKALGKLKDGPFDLIAVHHSESDACKFTEEARKRYPEALMVAVTGGVLTKEGRTKYLKGLGEEQPFDDVLPSIIGDVGATRSKIVRALEEIEAKQRAAGIT